MHLPVGITLQGGKYEIISYISSGGFGCTYKARHAMLNTTVAIKEFFVKDYCNRDASTYRISVATQSKAELIERLRKKFIEEAQAIFNMNHPNIVRVTDIFEENGTVYYVMDYIEGCSLASLIADKGRLCEKEALGYIFQVADALDCVHNCNRLHLDVKPQNVMIDKNGKAVLIDFGVSKQYDEVGGENTSTLLGCTPGYAPIEQSGNGVVRFYPSADIYALGATLYKALTGVTPVAAHLRASGEELDPLPADISLATRIAVEAAMKINKAHRPQSVAEFLKLLENGGKSKDERAESKDERGKSKDETLLNSSSTPGGEVSRSGEGESELSTVKTENAKNYTASPDDEETHVGINPPRPSATPPFEKVGELSKVDIDDEEMLLNSENGVDDATLHTESVSVLQIDKPSFKEENEENISIKSLWIIPLLLLIAGGYAWFFGGAEEQAYLEYIAEYERIVAEPEPEALSPAAGYENGYGYVDLGLSVKWATCNVGASSPEEYGGYYAWGETEEKRNYDWSSYKWCNGSYDTMTKYCTSSGYGTVDNKTTLDPQDDVAHVKWGGSWRMPTTAEQDELRNNCSWKWTTHNGVNGYKVTGPNGNSIFLPAAGTRIGTGLGDSGSYGYYWSSSLYESLSNVAYDLFFYSGYQNWSHYNRFIGLSVRPVSK